MGDPDHRNPEMLGAEEARGQQWTPGGAPHWVSTPPHGPTPSTHAHPGAALTHTHTHAHTHTHVRIRKFRVSLSHSPRHARTATARTRTRAHDPLKAAGRGVLGRGGGGAGAPFSEACPNPYQTRPLHPSPGLQDPILSRWEMCNSRAGTAPPPGGQARTPRPRVQLEVGPGEGSPGKARGWGTGREAPTSSCCLAHGGRRAAWGEQGGEAGTTLAPPGPPQRGSWDLAPLTRDPSPQPGSFQKPCLPLDIIAFLPPWGPRGTEDSTRTLCAGAASTQGSSPQAACAAAWTHGHPRGAPSSPRPGPGHRGGAGGRGRWHRSLSLGEEERGTGNRGEVVRAGDTNQKGKIQFL